MYKVVLCKICKNNKFCDAHHLLLLAICVVVLL